MRLCDTILRMSVIPIIILLFLYSMKEEINKAVEILRKGGVILYPTDTVWGIGCDATNPQAVARVYEIKKRPDSKSLVLLADGVDMICRYVKEIPEMALQLIEVNDKPMTIIYPGAICGTAPEAGDNPGTGDRFSLAYNTVAADGTVGIRIPMMDFCREMCRILGRPVVSTSANVSGHPTPKTYAEISAEIKDAVDHVCDPSLEKQSLGSPSQIIKVGLDYSVEVIRA